MKTAMQLMVEMLDTRNINYKDTSLEGAYDSLLAITVKLLVMEKEQIIDAYNQGYRDGELLEESLKKGTDVMEYSDAADYFDTKFK